MTRRGPRVLHAGASAASSHAKAAAPGRYAPAAKAGFKATTERVQEMHHAIADKTFDVLKRVPLIALPSRVVQVAHDAIVDGVYAAVRHGGAAVLSAVAVAEAARQEAPPRARPAGQALRSALNGMFGDSLRAADDPLAWGMSLHADHAPLLLTSEALAGLQPRVALFIHGLACDERNWHRPHAAWDGEQGVYGARLESELGISPIYLRYNSGLAVADNAHELAALIDRLIGAAPQVRELTLIGHSMGGLLARGACEEAEDKGAAWLDRIGSIICLGTPHRGAPLESLGHLAVAALRVSDVTRPLARIADTRSRGIKDLRHGLRGHRGAGVPMRLVSGSLAEASGRRGAALTGAILGDGLVRRASAEDATLAGDIERVALPGLGHMALLNHPRVYMHLRRWLTPASAS
jgi:pimeloyl-ACP methyl ester carboxylesterase